MKPIIFILSLVLVFNIPVIGRTNIQFILQNSAEHQIIKVDAFDLSQKEFNKHQYNDTLFMNFNKSNIDCYNIRYHTDGKMFRQQIWLDTGNITIEAHISDDEELIIDTVINSPFYYQVRNFNKDYLELSNTLDSAAINDFLLTSFRNNIDNVFSLAIGNSYISRNQNSKGNLLKFKSLADIQGDKFSWFLIYSSVVDRLDKLLTVDNINLSDYNFLNKTNKKIKIDLTGAEYYVLDFWFLACVPCVEQHVTIKKNLNKLKDKNVQLIGVSTDTNIKRWNAYLDKHKYVWQNYLQDENQVS